MKISLEWLSQYVEISDLKPESIADKLTMACAEVEGLHSVRRSFDGVFVGEIIEAKQIQQTENLIRVTIDCYNSTFTSVCGAPNVSVGKKSAFAPIGALLADSTKVQQSTVGGIVTQGILCSAKELGLSDYQESILEFPSSIENGTPLTDLIPKQDTIMEIDNKSLTHRPDLWGHYGIAREVAAIFERELEPLNLTDLTQYSHLPAYPLTIEDPENCPCYCCIKTDEIEAIPSPLCIQWRLHAIGQRTINIQVDLTNYIMFELGQPTHAFDGRKLKAIRVAPFGVEGKFLTLDGVERIIMPEDLMIWDNNRPIALAGIMGGGNTEIDEDTTTLLLESANFKGSRVRRTASRLGVRSEASQRFEKNQPAVNTRLAIARFLWLVEEAGIKPNVLSSLTIRGDTDEDRPAIKIPLSFFKKKIGIEIPPERVAHILCSLGFNTELKEGLLAIVPPSYRSRADISVPEDIIEETARIYGFDSIAPQMPEISMQPALPNINLKMQHSVRKLLASSHQFTEKRWIDTIGFDPGKTLVLENPSAEYLDCLRTTLIPNLLAMVRQNIQHRDSFRLFEIGSVFKPAGSDSWIENTYLAGVSHKQLGRNLERHFRSIKGVVEDIAEVAFKYSPQFSTSVHHRYPWDEEGTEILLGCRKIGTIGILPESIREKIGKKAEIIWFELKVDLPAVAILPSTKYEQISRYPGSWLDFSIVWETSKGYQQLQDRLSSFSHPLLKGNDFVYLYQGKEIAEGYGSYTFRYWIGLNERTIAGEEIEGFNKDFMLFLESNDLKLRS
jgi:phenylalanyl-tRNA synthetase beta chain